MSSFVTPVKRVIGTRQTRTVSREGDWICVNCSNLNFSFRRRCNRCRSQTKEQNDVDLKGLPSNGTHLIFLPSECPEGCLEAHVQAYKLLRGEQQSFWLTQKNTQGKSSVTTEEEERGVSLNGVSQSAIVDKESQHDKMQQYRLPCVSKLLQRIEERRESGNNRTDSGLTTAWETVQIGAFDGDNEEEKDTDQKDTSIRIQESSLQRLIDNIIL